jgi:hypothetical protein
MALFIRLINGCSGLQYKGSEKAAPSLVTLDEPQEGAYLIARDGRPAGRQRSNPFKNHGCWQMLKIRNSQ